MNPRKQTAIIIGISVVIMVLVGIILYNDFTTTLIENPNITMVLNK